MSEFANWFLTSGDKIGDAIFDVPEIGGINSQKQQQKDMAIVLASSSENRRKLLEQIDIHPLIYASECPEDLPRTLPLAEFVEQTAKQKAHNVFKQITNHGKTKYDVIIGCDTMISIDGQMIGKPKDAKDAISILKSLDGRTHFVRTGVCILTAQGKEELFSVETEVEFGKIGEELIRKYVETGESIGRAGAYAIQGKGAVLVKAIRGSYSNVVGLPINEVVKKLDEMMK